MVSMAGSVVIPAAGVDALEEGDADDKGRVRHAAEPRGEAELVEEVKHLGFVCHRVVVGVVSGRNTTGASAVMSGRHSGTTLQQ